MVDAANVPVSLTQYRDQLRLFYEALIWVLLLVDQARKGGGLVRRRVTSPEMVFNVVGGRLEFLSAHRIEQYWIQRFPDPSTGRPFADTPTRLVSQTVANDSPTLRLAAFFKTIAQRAQREGVSIDAQRAVRLKPGVGDGMQ